MFQGLNLPEMLLWLVGLFMSVSLRSRSGLSTDILISSEADDGNTRYRSGDLCEAWLNQLLCLDATSHSLGGGNPSTQDCSLYYINRFVHVVQVVRSIACTVHVCNSFPQGHFVLVPLCQRGIPAPGDGAVCRLALQELSQRSPTPQ